MNDLTIGTTTLFIHVEDTTASAAFYADLLGIVPVEASPTFALFVLGQGLALGLWDRRGVTPPAGTARGGSEIGFRVDDPAAVDRIHAAWAERRIRIALPPTDLDFGRSFVALDPDGYAIRVYHVEDEA